jgi:purine-nucleoside phosphorylase
MRVLGISVVANVNDPDHFKPIRIDEIIRAARKAGPRLQQLVINLLAELKP